jgi:hypothetical protein
MISAFEALVSSRLAATGEAWPPEDDFATAFASASRLVGKAALVIAADEIAVLQTQGVDWPLHAWTMDDAARAVLLMSAAKVLRPAELVTLAEETFRDGDSREKAAILRALPLLPAPKRFVPLAVEACRTSVQPVFEAIACENPFPAEYFPDLNFNQLVLKALFIQVPLSRVARLDRRLTPELARMARDYAAERAAAGRSIPDDIARLSC